ncbi:hypothetical protein J6590_100759 [Homalodisca vitripennis]|nr:hypothetical protein J6590_100759 [Homalodisca vitripennis]
MLLQQCTCKLNLYRYYGACECCTSCDYKQAAQLDHFWLVYTYELNPPLGTAKTDVPLQSGQPYGYSGVNGQFDRSSLLWKMTVGVSGVCSLTSEVLVNLNKGVPPPAYFDWRGWFRAGLPFFRDDFEM